MTYKPYFPNLARCAENSPHFNEIISLVNDQDEVVCSHWRAYPKPKGCYTQIGATFVLNNENQLVLQRSSKRKFKHPDKWTFSSGGHISAGETYEVGALRELKEELGIDGVAHSEIGVIRAEKENGQKGAFYHVFLVYHNGPYDIDTRETQGIQAFDISNLKTLIQKNAEEFNPTFLKAFCLFCEKMNF